MGLRKKENECDKFSFLFLALSDEGKKYKDLQKEKKTQLFGLGSV